MKRETIIWQAIILILGLFIVFTLRTYLQDKIEIEAETNRADCLIKNYEKGLGISILEMSLEGLSSVTRKDYVSAFV